MQRISLAFAFFLLSLRSFAQITDADLARLQEYEDTIALLSYAVINDSLPEHRFGATKKLIPTLVQALKIPNSFQYPFPDVQSISIQYPADSSFRIFTWQLYVDAEEYRYYGAIQLNSPDLKLSPLVDRSYEVQNPEMDILTPENWYGALYYHIEAFESPQGRKYLLFGYDAYSFFEKRKIVEVLSIEQGKPVFGAPVFVEQPLDGSPVQYRNRLVFQYSSEASMRCNFDPMLGLIVFDHLVNVGGPYLVPDGDYDGYIPQNGFWVFKPRLFDQVSEEAPRPYPVLEGQQLDIFGNSKKE